MSPRLSTIEAQLEEVSGAVLTPVRWVVLLGILASYQLRFGLHGVERSAIPAAVAVYAALAAALPHLRDRPLAPRLVARLLLAADLLFSAAIFHLTDGIRSPYFGLWYLALIHAALVLNMGTSMAIAAGTAALVVAHEWLLPFRHGAPSDLNMAIGKLPFLLLIAWSAARLALEVRERESARRRSERRAISLEAEEQRRHQELETARRVQESLLPLAMRTPCGLTMAVLSYPAREVGGDTYDVIELPDGQLLVNIADVSGKGMPAALLAAVVQQAVRQFAASDPGAVLAGVNGILLDNSPDQMFVTAACVVLDPRDGRAAAANAGHPPILWWNDAERRLVPVSRHGPILGLVPEWSAPAERWSLAPGDVLILYTDGLEDAKTTPDERLGQEALIEILSGEAPHSAQDWIDRLQSTLKACVALPDDVTALVIRREPAPAPAAGSECGPGAHVRAPLA